VTEPRTFTSFGIGSIGSLSARSHPHLLGGMKIEGDQRGCRHEHLIEKDLVFYLLMTTSTLFSYFVVQLGLLSNLLRRSAGIVLVIPFETEECGK
jgi:hypothetical protein